MIKLSSKDEEMNVAFILHPLNVSEFKRNAFYYAPFDQVVSFLVRKYSPSTIKNFFSLLPPHMFLKVSKLVSCENKKINILGIMCPVFPQELMSQKKTFTKVLNAVKLAIKKGADVVVLTGFTSIVSNEGEDIRKVLRDHPVIITSGNAYTAALSMEGIYSAAEFFHKDITNCTLAIIGATGDIGTVCSKVLSRQFKRTILCSRTISANDWSLSGSGMSGGDIVFERSVSIAVKDADFILLATSSFIPLLDVKDVKRNSIICDTSLPHNLDKNCILERRDVFAFDGGMAKLTFPFTDTKWQQFLVNDAIFGCIAEGMALGFERLSGDFSIGRGKITENDVEEIKRSGSKHGIQLADFSFHGRQYTTQELERYKAEIS